MPIPIGLIGGGIAGLAGIGKTIFGASQARKARKAIESYQRQDLDNVFDDIQISTMGSDLMREENARATATGVDMLGQGGVRGVVGGVPKLVAQNTLANREAQVYLDDQYNRRQYAVAGDEARIRDMQERREESDLAGLGQQMMVGQQNMWNGIGDVTSSLMFMDNKGLFNGEDATI